jgi:hypothetical protein
MCARRNRSSISFLWAIYLRIEGKSWEETHLISHFLCELISSDSVIISLHLSTASDSSSFEKVLKSRNKFFVSSSISIESDDVEAIIELLDDGADIIEAW